MDGTGRDGLGRGVVCVVGTRPEAVKMAPIVANLRKEPRLDVRLVTTGQHRGLLDRALADFGLEADVDLDLMRPGQSLAESTGRALAALSAAFNRLDPCLVLAQGDTTTVVASALAAYYQKVPFGHVEAGLRTGQPYRPFPEEKNRVVASHLAELHFAPTDQARDNLLREGIAPDAIHVTGNTEIDTLRLSASREVEPAVRVSTGRYLLVTAHRRENQGEPLKRICAALADLVRRHQDLSIVFPVHPNPRVGEVVRPALGGLDRVRLVEPQGYHEFVTLMRRSFLILTDSGGVQEAAPALGKPVLVLRDETERPEAVRAGTVQLVGTRRESIVEAVEALLSDPARYQRYATVLNPYGDGWAADRIGRVVRRRLGLEPGAMPVGIPETWSAATAST